MVKIKYDFVKGEWIELPKGSREGMYMDGFLYRSCKKAREVMQTTKNYLPIAISGYPGLGKTTILTQVATFFDPNFSEKDVVFKPIDFINLLKEAKPLSSKALDESYEGLSSEQIRKTVGQTLKVVLNVVRKKRLYIFIVIPNFFDLSKSVAVFLTRWLIHCYSEAFGDVGRMVMFDRNTKRILYLKGKRFEDYNCIKADAKGVFTKYIPKKFNWENYEKAKDEYLQQLGEEDNDNENSFKKQRDRIICKMKKKFNLKTPELVEITRLSPSSIRRIVKE